MNSGIKMLKEFCVFSLLTKNYEMLPKNSPFSNECHFWSFISKKGNNYIFFRRKYLDYTKETQFYM